MLLALIACPTHKEHRESNPTVCHSSPLPCPQKTEPSLPTLPMPTRPSTSESILNKFWKTVSEGRAHEWPTAVHQHGAATSGLAIGREGLVDVLVMRPGEGGGGGGSDVAALLLAFERHLQHVHDGPCERELDVLPHLGRGRDTAAEQESATSRTQQVRKSTYTLSTSCAHMQYM